MEKRRLYSKATELERRCQRIVFSVDTVDAKSVVLPADKNERMRGVKMQRTGQRIVVRLRDRSDRGHIQNIVREMCCGTLGQWCRGLKEDGKGIRLN